MTKTLMPPPQQRGGLPRAIDELTESSPRAPRPASGHIALVGAGPGSADLLTLRAIRRLRSADIVFYDRLVDPEVLDLVPPSTPRIYVGKAPGAHSMSQAEICAAITAAARDGAHVVRIKGGDPAVFARTEEELAAAKAANIPTEIVPGITAASAAAAALNRPLTERGQTRRLVLATAITRANSVTPDLGLALTPGTTLAIYMGLGAAGKIRETFLAQGLPGDLEVEVIARAASPAERILRCSLFQLPDALREAGIDAPTIILIRYPLPEHGEDSRALVAASVPAELAAKPV